MLHHGLAQKNCWLILICLIEGFGGNFLNTNTSIFVKEMLKILIWDLVPNWGVVKSLRITVKLLIHLSIFHVGPFRIILKQICTVRNPSHY